MERRHAARRPPETLLRVPQIAHDVSVFPAALLRARSAQVSRRRRSVVHGAQPVEQNKTVVFMLVVYIRLVRRRLAVDTGQVSPLPDTPFPPSRSSTLTATRDVAQSSEDVVEIDGLPRLEKLRI